MYEIFFNYSDNILLILSNKGELLESNNSFCSVVGYSREQQVAKNIQHFIAPSDIHNLLTIISGLSPERLSDNFSHDYICSDEKRVRVNSRAFLAFETDNIHIISQQIVNSDNAVTNITKFEMDKLIKDTAHEINNPLGIISGYTELIKAQCVSDTNLVDKLDVILASTERIKNTLQDLKQSYCCYDNLEHDI